MKNIEAEDSVSTSSERLLDAYRQVRRFSLLLCEPLAPEDCVVQSMPDVSPTRWHLAHTTWFFETFVLQAAIPGYRTADPAFEYLFNSYYNGVGRQFPRPRRGLLSRPTVAEVIAYRQRIDAQIESLLDADDAPAHRLRPVIELGIHHEQQHQELMLTDIKHVFFCNPLFPTYADRPQQPSPNGLSKQTAGSSDAACRQWRAFDERLVQIGHAGTGFAYDNESPRHRVFLESFELADRLVTCGEYLQFVQDGGYRTPLLWLSLGWQQVATERWNAPLYWLRKDGRWCQFTLHGLRPLDLDEPVCHVSYFEADAFARWSGRRLPTEAEWETAAESVPVKGNFVERGLLHPQAVASHGEAEPLRQMYGDVWEWTASSYAAYPGYAPPAGAIGEYNGKFMCNQYVLRGGSCATSRSHVRRTYRNFFPPETRWQFTGIRLARSGPCSVASQSRHGCADENASGQCGRR